MRGKFGKIVVWGFLVLLVGLGGYMGWHSRQMKKTIESQAADIDQLNRQKRALINKYAEEKARGAAVLRAKLAVEAQKRLVEEELETLKKENTDLRSAQNDFELEVAKRIKSYETKLTALAGTVNGLQAERKQLQADLKKARRTIAAREADVESLNNAKRSLLADLETRRREIEQIRGHNKELVALAQELIVRYEEKGTGKILLENEPFLRLDKVEWEHLKQEYLDRIDKHALVNSGN